MNIYVGNLSPRTSQSELRRAFEMYGKVDKVSLEDKPLAEGVYNFCFIEMPFASQAARAITHLDGKALRGNALTVRESGVSI